MICCCSLAGTTACETCFNKFIDENGNEAVHKYYGYDAVPLFVYENTIDDQMELLNEYINVLTEYTKLLKEKCDKKE